MPELKTQRPSALSRWVESVLDWTPIQRALLLSVLIVVESLQYAAWGVLTLLLPPVQTNVNLQVSHTFMPVTGLATLASFMVLGLCFYYRHSTDVRLNRLIPFIMAHCYAVTMVYFGYLVGTLSMASGVVVMGAPIFGLMMLERRVVYSALTLSLVLLLGLTFLALKGTIAYAPLLIHSDKNGIVGSGFWFWSMLFFMMPHMLVSVFMCDLLMSSLRRREQDVRYLSERDTLTGLHNRRSISQSFNALIQQYRYDQMPVAVLLLDLDHFKKINDTYGHLSGDYVLVEATQVMQKYVRTQDLVGRFGGEEFVIIAPNISHDEALSLAERIRHQIAALVLYSNHGERISVTTSIGLMHQVIDEQSMDHLFIHHADRALYAAKSNGRNCVVSYDHLCSPDVDCVVTP